jgi:hypothetical protein
LKREILINGSQRETRVAILEDDRLVELLVDLRTWVKVWKDPLRKRRNITFRNRS